MAFYQLVSKNILIPTCQDFRWTDAIPITTVDETETETETKMAKETISFLSLMNSETFLLRSVRVCWGF